MNRLVYLFAIFFLASSLFLAPSAKAQATYTATSCNQVDVNAIINGPKHVAANGDTIQIPAGSCTWTSGITVPAGIGISIISAGTPNSTASIYGASASCSSTVISVANGLTVFSMSPNYGNSPSRLSCMKLQPGGTSDIAFVVRGTCAPGGCPNLRVDNLTVSGWTSNTPTNSYGIAAVGGMFGVLDHNTVSGAVDSGHQFVEFGHASYLGVGQYGDNSWAQPESYGSANFLFFENNQFSGVGTTESETTAVPTGGGRIVVRFNQFINMDNNDQMMSGHGTESNGRPRGPRAFELYGNTYTCTGDSRSSNHCDTAAAQRSGTGLVWGNSITGGLNTGVKLNTYRDQGNPGGWGPCDGSSPYDANDGVTYFDGTVSAWNSSTGLVTVSGAPGWSNNQWVRAGAPYSLHDVTQNNGTEIGSNGPNTLTISIGGGPGAFRGPNVGDHIEILRASACLDQGAGRGAGMLYSGNPAPQTPANEVLSPPYMWMNTFASAPSWDSNTGFSVNNGRIIRNRDFYAENLNQGAQSNNMTPFNGSTTIGVGHGTLANRPSTCTAGVGYWATDQGSWNQSGGAEQGEFYVCTAANTWTLSYTPYTYPHPLVSGGSSSAGANPPNPPTNLAATVQ